MAWTERTRSVDETIKEVDPPSDKADQSEYSKLKRILRDMPPFIKITSRRARKILAKYEELKQRHIVALRENPTLSLSCWSLVLRMNLWKNTGKGNLQVRFQTTSL